MIKVHNNTNITISEKNGKYYWKISIGGKLYNWVLDVFSEDKSGEYSKDGVYKKDGSFHKRIAKWWKGWSEHFGNFFDLNKAKNLPDDSESLDLNKKGDSTLVNNVSTETKDEK